VGLIRALAGVGLCLLFCVAGLAVELPRGADSAGPLTDPSHWRKWLPEISDAADVSLPVIAPLPPLTMATSDPIRQRFMDQALVQQWASGPASLPWNRLALELIVKYQQNPLRAARVLAHLHAAAHDAIVGLAATSSEEAAQAVAVHAAAAGVLAHFYPRESPGRLEAIGIGAILAVAASARMSPQTLDFARAAGRRAATDAIRRALDDGGDATWNPADRPPPAPRLWRAAPPLNLANPGEPLAGKWRTWALADGREMPPLPPLFGSERYWEEAREVLRVARRLSVEQKRVADEWNLDKGSVTPAGVWNRKAMHWVGPARPGYGGDRTGIGRAQRGDGGCARRLLAGEVRTLERAAGQRHPREARSGLSALVIHATVSELRLGSCGSFQRGCRGARRLLSGAGRRVASRRRRGGDVAPVRRHPLS
jgi:hypothetical protein